MAQAVYDDHPIEQYLRESGETPELMPGGVDEFSRPLSHDPYYTPFFQRWLPRLRPLLNRTLRILESTGWRSHSPGVEFAERFKYVVISSSLLSPSLASYPPNRAPTPTTPGHYDHNPSLRTVSPPAATQVPSSSTSPLMTFSLAFLVPAALVQGYYLSGLIILAAVKICSDHGLLSSSSLKQSREDESYAMALDSLETLISVNNAWDGVVGEALWILENQERTIFHPSSPSSPTTPLRIAFSSSLHTTQTQCDNVRQLLSALTAPLVLSQLSEMYAPPSPMHTSFPGQSSRTRPISLAATPQALNRANPPTLLAPTGDNYTRARTTSAPQAFQSDKRATWNGSYMSLVGPDRSRQRRRSNLSSIIHLEDLKSPTLPKGSSSVPPTPSQPLMADAPPTVEDASGDADAEDEPFGIAALDLHRKRRGTRALLLEKPLSPSTSSRIASPSVASTQSGNVRESPSASSFPAGSRFTTLSSPASSTRTAHQHTLSISNLHLALQGALASKRFACSHLLALRFSEPSGTDAGVCSDTEGEDESYWEDVRSVIGLLTSTLEDATARLTDALRREEQAMDGESSRRSVSLSPEPPKLRRREPMSPAQPRSFAPMPSHLSRFAAHVDAISSALDDAREHIRECVASLRDPPDAEGDDGVDVDSPLESYERLRRELGIALRECERGRGTLLEIIQRRSLEHMDKDGRDEDEDDSPVRQDGHLSSGESDKTMYHHADELLQLDPSKAAYQLERDEHEIPRLPHHHHHDRDDDASAHLILTASSQHLPPPGIEQVFESLSAGSPNFLRERSKLTREERIRIAKARRESGGAAGVSTSTTLSGEEEDQSVVRERWGPGGDVVQELKDVIWKVGERRRKMAVGRSRSPTHPPITQPLPSPL